MKKVGRTLAASALVLAIIAVAAIGSTYVIFAVTMAWPVMALWQKVGISLLLLCGVVGGLIHLIEARSALRRSSQTPHGADESTKLD